jgi:hypothetical protein
LISFLRIYPDQLAALSGLTAYQIPQPQAGVRYITTSPHGLTTGQPTGTYTIG